MAASENRSSTLLVGIDPGERTGFAVFDTEAGRLTRVETLDFWSAAAELRGLAPDVTCVVVEDARHIGLYARRGGLSGARRDRAARSVGRVDRDVTLWLGLCERLRLPVATVTPTRKKWDAETFRRVTGWKGRTSEHGRDAARLVYGMSVGQVLLLATVPRNQQPATSSA